MDTIFVNSESSKTSEPHVSILKLTNKEDLRIGEKIIPLSNLSIYDTWKNIKNSYNNNKFKISAPKLNDKFELPYGQYSVSNIQDYFEYILKKHGENSDKPSVQLYVSKIENSFTFKIKNSYSVELLTTEIMKILGSTENKKTKDKSGENVPYLEITEVVQFTVTLLIMIINKIQEFCICLFQINRFAVCQKFLQRIISF